jgi:predicted alpha/beta-fold hydrolase
LFRRVKGVLYTRERIFTQDGDFLDLDWSRQGGRSLAIIGHGLEGCSTQSYILGMVQALNQAGWDTLSWNFRGCSGELNYSAGLYHAGSFEDLQQVIDHALRTGVYDTVALVGFSLGGHLILKYLGELGEQIPQEVARAVVFSVPCDIKSCVETLARSFNRIYLRRFLTTLKSKMMVKAKQFPHLFHHIDISKIHDFFAFDSHFTVPLWGYRDLLHYYEACSCKHAIARIRVPTLIVNSKNDPFLNEQCYPVAECTASQPVVLELTKQGGHMGFIKDSVNGRYWSEERAVDFLAA